MEDQQASGWNEMGDLVAKNDVSQVPFYLQPANKTKIKEVSAAKGVPVEAMLGNIQKSLSLGQTTPQKAQQELDAHHATVTKKPSVGMPTKLPQKAVSPMAMMGPTAPLAPMSSPQSPQEQPGTVITDTALVPVKGSFESATEGDSTKDTQTETSKNRLDSSAANEQYQTWANLPVNKDNEGMIGNLQDRVNRLSRMPQEDWLKPLLAYSDSKFGGNLMAGYIPPPAQKLLLKYEDELAKRTAQKGEDFNKYLAASGSGSSVDAYAVTEYNKTIDGVKHPVTNVQEMRQQMMDSRAHQQNINLIKKDPILRTFDNNRNTLENGLNILAGNHTNKQVLFELQNATRPALLAMAGAARLTGGEREEQQVSSVATKLGGWIQEITGRPQDQYMKKDDPILKHIKELIGSGISSIKSLGPRRMQFLAQGNKSVYDRNPDKKQDLEDLMNAWTSTGKMSGSFKDGAYNPNEQLPTMESAPEGTNPATMKLQQKTPSAPQKKSSKAPPKSGTTNVKGPDGLIHAVKNSMVKQALAAGGSLE